MPFYHQLTLPVWDDPDADLLATHEAGLLGADPVHSDEDGNGFPDGVDLAHSCAAAIAGLPEVASPTLPYLTYHHANGLETSGVCGEVFNMGVIDGLQIARELRGRERALPRVMPPAEPPKDRPYTIVAQMDGYESCPCCG